MYNVFRKFQKVLIWTLIFIIALSNLFIILGSPKKAKAADVDPANPGFYKAEAGVEAPQNFKYQADSGGTIIMTWEHTRGHSTNTVPGFIVKSGTKAPIDCTRGSWGSSGPVDNMKCDDQSSFSATNEESGDSRVSKYTFHDKGVMVSALPAGMSLLVQVLVPLVGYSPIVGAKVEGSVDQVVLGPGFEDDNIEKYIANKLFPYQKSGKEVPGTSSDWVGEALFASKEDQNNFKSFMENFKNAAGSENRVIIKELDAGNVDPFGIQGFTEDKNGQKVYHPALSESELTTIYDKYYKNYQGFSNNKDFIAFINDQINQYNELMKGKENSCQDLVNRLTTSDNWKQAYSQFGAVIGGGGAAIIGAYTGGVSLPWTGGAAAGGYVVGETIEEMVRASQKDDIDKQLLDITKKSWAAYYSLLYVEFKETKLGLNAYANEGNNLTQEVGINPNKIHIITNVLAEFDNSWNICFKSVNDLTNSLYNDNCGLSLKGFSDILATALCAVLKLMGDIAKWMIDNLFTSTFNAYHPPPNLHLAFALTSPFKISSAHAEEVSSLTQALTVNGGGWDWVIPAWKWSLGLIDLFSVVILLFLGIVNILHIQYDTYNLKKALPLLIVGVILANFSLLVMRMLIDAANILTHSFMGGQDPGTMAKSMITAAKFGTTNPGFVGSVSTLGGLLVAIIFSVFILAAFLILGFMFYMRYAAVILLAIVAPIAFVFMAFPPTQSIFKQWWSWTTKMIFMKPLAFFLLYIAWKIEQSGNMGTSLTGWIIVTFIVYMAILIPWKLGGALASFWGGVGGTVFGTKKGGWARKPVDEWWQRRKDQAGAMVKTAFPKLFAGAEKDRMLTEAMKKTGMGRVKSQAGKKYNDQLAFWEGAAKTSEAKNEQELRDRLHDFQNADVKLGFWIRLLGGGVKWENWKKPTLMSKTDFARESASALAEGVMAQKDQEKSEGDLIAADLIRKGEDLKKAGAQMKALKDAGKYLRTLRPREDGTLEETEEFDDKGEPIRSNPFDYINAAEYLTRAALTTNDPNTRRNLENSAARMRKGAEDFMRKNQTINGEKIMYDAFMDKGRGGRIISYVFPIVNEDVSANSQNATPNEIEKALFTKGFSDRFRAIAANNFARYCLGQNKGLSQNEKLEGLQGQMLLRQLLRGASRETIGEYLEKLVRFSNSDLVTANSDALKDNAILKEAVDVEEGTDPGITLNTLGEQLAKAVRRGESLPGLENVDTSAAKPDLPMNQFNAKILDALKAHFNVDTLPADQKYSQVTEWLLQNPAIFASIDLDTRTGATQNSVNMIRGLINTYLNTSFLGGTGSNPVLMTYSTDNDDPLNILKEIRARNPKYSRKKNVGQAQQERRDEIAREVAEADSREQQTRRVATADPQAVAQMSPRQARQFRDDNADGFDNLLQDRGQLVSRIQTGGKPISVPDFHHVIADAIVNSVATQLRGLQDELRTKLNMPDLKIDAPDVELDSPEALVKFKDQVAEAQRGYQVAREVVTTNEAEEVKEGYTSYRANETKESMDRSLNELKGAFEMLTKTMESLKLSGASTAQVPEGVFDKIVEVLSNRADVVPLTQKALESDPTNLSETLRKVIIGLQSVRNLRENQSHFSDEELLRAIKSEVKKFNNKLENQLNPPSTTTPAAGGGQAGGQASGQENPPYTPNEEMPPEE